MPKKDSTLRVIELIREKNISPKELHEATGIKYNTITNALGDNNRNFTIEQIATICEVFGFSQTYCVFGTGNKYGYKPSDKIEIKENLNFDDIKEISNEIYEKEKLISYLQSQLEIKQSNAHIVENLNYMSVPIVHIKAQCGYLAGYGDAEYIDTLPTMPVIVDQTYHGKYRIFEAEGDSMDDGSRNSICDGDKLLCREVRRDLWLPKLHINDWYFVIVHQTKGISIKQITAQDDSGNITCHSLNELFNDYTVNLDDVVEIYNVIKVVERSMRL